MKFACLVYIGGADSAERYPAADAVIRDARAYDDELRQSGHFIMGQALQPARDAVTLRLRDGEMSATDGPFAETKEQLAGFTLIEAQDFDEAIRLARGLPMGRVATIEVRPFYVGPSAMGER